MRASRLLSILILLQLRTRVTAEALAEEFEVSVRTIYRDIDELSAAGIPVYGDRGPGGGFSLLDGYRTRLTGLTSEEAEAMVMIGLPAQAAALGLGAAAARAKGKLMASLTSAGGEDAGRMATRFHMDPVDWYRADEPARFLPAIARAVLDQRVVEMKYESWTGVREWRIEPLGLVLKAGAWYVVGQGGGKARIFRVSNILEETTLDDRFERPRDFDLPGYWAAELQRFETGLRPDTAQLLATREGLVRIGKLGAYAQEAVRNAGAPDADGWAPLTLPIESVEQVALAILGLGAEAKVLEPPAVRARLNQLAREVAALSAVPSPSPRT